MARGTRVEDGKKLLHYNTKLEKETKDLLAAVVRVQKLDGQRELITKMLEAYEKANPEDFKKARNLIAFLED
jgi:hypothetical protein